jgi:hypothetical protein
MASASILVQIDTNRGMPVAGGTSTSVGVTHHPMKARPRKPNLIKALKRL